LAYWGHVWARPMPSYPCRGIPFSPDDEARGRLAYRADASVKPLPSYPGVQSPPLQGTSQATIS